MAAPMPMAQVMDQPTMEEPPVMEELHVTRSAPATVMQEPEVMEVPPPITFCVIFLVARLQRRLGGQIWHRKLAPLNYCWMCMKLNYTFKTSSNSIFILLFYKNIYRC
jgi:hypothetical protein